MIKILGFGFLGSVAIIGASIINFSKKDKKCLIYSV